MSQLALKDIKAEKKSYRHCKGIRRGDKQNEYNVNVNFSFISE